LIGTAVACLMFSGHNTTHAQSEPAPGNLAP